MENKSEFVCHTVPKTISATSRCAIKVKDNFYTIEASETREITDTQNVDIEGEWNYLFEEINSVVDAQCEQIIKTFK